MPEFETIKIEVAARVAVLTVDRPQALNALNSRVLSELDAGLAGMLADPGVGALVVTGAGPKSFVAGADISEMLDFDPAAARQFSRAGQRVMSALEQSPKPVIAAVNGFCLGGGCELAMSCHLRVAGRSARLGQPEVKLGLIPGFGGTVRLARLVGRAKALELILTGEMISADEALRIGLVNRVVEDAEVVVAALELAGSILSRSPAAVAAALETVRRGSDLAVEPALAWESTMFGLSFSTRDAREGMAAFLEKRPARFTGD